MKNVSTWLKSDENALGVQGVPRCSKDKCLSFCQSAEGGGDVTKSCYLASAAIS